MTKLKFLPIFFLLITTLFSCKDDDDKVTAKPFDHKAQAIIDAEILEKFLKNNYYDAINGDVKELIAGETALYDDDKLSSKIVSHDPSRNKAGNIDYKLYSYNVELGTGSSPSIVDSVFVNYRGLRIKDNKLGTQFQETDLTWFTLADPYQISAWSYSFPDFKGGKQIPHTTGKKITYENYGKAILFIPSGLAFKNEIGLIGANQNVVYYIDFLDAVTDTDHDNDGIPSMLEDLNGDGNPFNDNTDGGTERKNEKRTTPNFLDYDDDGDGIPTKYEDANKDGNPANDFSDLTNNPNLPDYLNQKVRDIHNK